MGSRGFEFFFYLAITSMAIISLAASNSASPKDLKEALLKVWEDDLLGEVCYLLFHL